MGGVSGALCCALGGLRKGGRSVLTLRGTRRPIRRRHSPVRDVRKDTDDISGERERRSLRESGAGTHEVEVVGRGVDEVEPLLRDLGRVQGRDPDPAASDGAEIARAMHGGEQQKYREAREEAHERRGERGTHMMTVSFASVTLWSSTISTNTHARPSASYTHPPLHNGRTFPHHDALPRPAHRVPRHADEVAQRLLDRLPARDERSLRLRVVRVAPRVDLVAARAEERRREERGGRAQERRGVRCRRVREAQLACGGLCGVRGDVGERVGKKRERERRAGAAYRSRMLPMGWPLRTRCAPGAPLI